MFDVTENDPISPAMHALLRLFGNELKAVKFPDLDRGVLEAAAEQVKERAIALAHAQASLDAARHALHDSQEALLQKGQRALAYVRIFAEENPELAQQLDGISLQRPLRKTPAREGAGAVEENAAPKRRGRPPKVPRPTDSLFAEPGVAAPEPPTGEINAAA